VLRYGSSPPEATGQTVRCTPQAAVPLLGMACLRGRRRPPTYRGRVTITTGTGTGTGTSTGTDGAAGLEVEPGPATPSSRPPAAVAPSVVTAPEPVVPGLLARARADGVTGPAVVAMSAALVLVGALLDLGRDATTGLGSGIAVLLAALAAPAVVRFRSLATAAVLPPLLLAAAMTVVARFGGHDRGLRELGLDVGTSLALSAPLLFGASALALLVVLVRVVRRLATR
jgi:hypothetical protein